MLRLCESFIQEFGVPNHVPFVAADEQPVGYAERLRVVREFLRRDIYWVEGDSSDQKSEPDTAREREDLLKGLDASG